MPSDARNTPPDSAPILLNVQQAAELLNISSRTLWAMKASGRVPFLKIGARVLFPKAKLLAWVESQIQGGSQ